jgi:hypothetical protein
MSDTPPPDKIWIPNKPEQRFSIAVNRLLTRTLLEPCYFSAQHDADEGGRTDNQRARDANRGQKPGPLDWEVWQEPGLARRLELKRGTGVLTANQRVTIGKLTACRCPPVVAWTVREVHTGLAAAGFRFTTNVRFVVVEVEAHLDAWDREAANIKAGLTVRKKSRPKKTPPRFVLGKQAVARARKAGIRV